jgi:hypothetical protein
LEVLAGWLVGLAARWPPCAEQGFQRNVEKWQERFYVSPMRFPCSKGVLQQEIKVINYFDYVLQNTLWVNGIWKGFM